MKFAFAAVLTGDIVASRTAPPNALNAGIAAILEIPRSLPDARAVRTRGDGWQLFLPDGRIALRAALLVTARLSSLEAPLKTRIGIGLGAATLPADEDLAAGSGEAFEAAGDLLDGMKRGPLIKITPQAGAIVEALVTLLAHQAERWTRPQAAALFEALRDQTQTQEDIAQTMAVTRQAIQDRLSKVDHNALRAALDAFEGSIKETWERAHA